MNVCTFGYTTPFWGWAEWEREIDWMALHGFDMPLAPIAGEAILARVWREMGLTDEEINVLFTGPAHLPWMRMGNMSGLDGAPSNEWHEEQIALQHRIIERMRSLGMAPVFQGFAGFVPPAMKRLYPEVKLTETKWSGFKNWMLSPLDPLFSEVGTKFIQAWEQEFGKGKYYLIDSFNEMDIPFGLKGSTERAATLRHYGQTIYRSLAAANPDAVWVMQGWMFGYQRNIWDPESVEALLDGAPEGRMMILDLAVDFNNYIWRSENSWNHLSGFFGRDWIYSTVPNFGGRSALIGNMEFYANGHLDALASPDKGCLTGYGTSPEGIENNDIIYEIIASAGWSCGRIDVKKFLHAYSRSRYGDCPVEVDAFWAGMLRSSYGECTNNARYRWQTRPYAHRMPTMGINEHYYAAIESFLACADRLNHSELYRTDAVQYAALYLCSKADMLLAAFNWADLRGDSATAQAYAARTIRLLLDADRLLASHPLLRLERWSEMAREAGRSEAEKKLFVEESRRLVSTWGGPSLSDYSARIWSGVIRDYYVPRLEHYFETKRMGMLFDFRKWDELWHTDDTISAIQPFADPLAAACRLVAEAKTDSDAGCGRSADAVAFWSPFELTKSSSRLSFTIGWEQFERARALRIVPVRGKQTVKVTGVLCTANRYNRVAEELSLEVGPRTGAVEIPLHKLEAPDPLSKEVTVYIRIEGKAAADNYAAVELIF
jgi:Alpha-N-acetylglucosaminidase (NAGLU).